MNKIKKLALFFAIILIFPISIVFGAVQDIKNPKDIQPVGFFNDFTNTIAPDSRQDIERTLSTYSAQTTNQIVVVMIDTLGEQDLSQYTNELFRDWGIGGKEKNNGVLFLIAKSDRKMRMEVGYGLEGDLTDIETKHIQDDIVAPFFGKGDYFSGINAGVDAMISGIGTELNTNSANNVSTVNILEKHFMTAFYIFLIFISFLVSTLAKSKSWWAGGVVGAIGGIVILYFSTLVIGIVSIIGLTILGLFFDRLVSRKYKDHKDNGTNFPWWMGGMGSGGFGSRGGGGFSGFGGGSSGGGGSSSSW